MLTCKKCVFNLTVVAPSKELVKNCSRFPPAMHLVSTMQGIITHIGYPVIKDDFAACGEYFDGIEVIDEDVETMSKLKLRGIN